jgi:hypothetical protein
MGRKRNSWDVMRRQRGVSAGANPIAMHDPCRKAHGPFMSTCSACGELYWPDRREEHAEVCRNAQTPLDISMWGIQIDEVARRHGLTVQETLAVAKELGIHATQASSPLSARTRFYLEEHIIARKRKAKEPEPPPPATS